MAAPRAKEFINWTPPQPSIDDVRSRFPLGISDEELLLRLLTSDRDVEAMMASGPLLTDPRNSSARIIHNLESIVADSGNATSLRIKTSSMSIDLKRTSVSA
jgi:oxaloacetate decarboxylase alpha subunit